jgi:hypothetical protein
VLLNWNLIVNIALTDFLTGFSRALDLLTPESGNRGLRRAFIAMTLLRQQKASEAVQQRVFVAALLYELGSERSWGLSDCQNLFSQVSIISDSMPLIFEKMSRLFIAVYSIWLIILISSP